MNRELIGFVIMMLPYEIGTTILVSYHIQDITPTMLMRASAPAFVTIIFSVLSQPIKKKTLYYGISLGLTIVGLVRPRIRTGLSGSSRICDAPKCVPQGDLIIGIVVGIILIYWIIRTIGLVYKILKSLIFK